MADLQIKDLTTNASPALTDVMAEDNASNVTYKSTKQKLFDLISSLAAITSATAASDTVPVNISGTTSKMTLLNVIKNMVAPSTSGNVLTSNGTNWTSAAAQAAKWWLECNAAGTINASYNVTSITDDGTGLVTVTIGTDFSSATWAAFGTGLQAGAVRSIMANAALAAGAVTFRSADAADSVADPTKWFLCGFGDQ